MGTQLPTTVAPTRVRRTFLDYVHTKTFTPREYQVELLDISKEKNVVVCMGKGIGKTFIAVMLIRELSSQTRHLPTLNSKKTVFLALNGNAVKQKKRILEDHTDLKVGGFFRALAVDLWEKEEWEEAIKAHQILVMTPDILLDVLGQKAIELSQINLLILEDCQRALSMHPYHEVMRLYTNYSDKANRPRILGLCPSLLSGKSKPKELKKEIETLEKMLLSTVETASDLVSFNQYVTKPVEEVIKYEKFTIDEPFFLEMQSCLNQALDFFYDLVLDYDSSSELPHPTEQPIRYLIEVSYILVTFGPWCAYKVSKIFLVEISRIMEFFCHSEIYIQMILVARTVLETIVNIFLKVQDEDGSKFYLNQYVPHNLKKLLQLLKPYKPEEEEEKSVTETVPKIEDGESANEPKEDENEVKVSEEPESVENVPIIQNAIRDNAESLTKVANCDSAKGNSRFKIMAFGRRRPYVTEAMAAADAKALCAVVFVKQKVAAYALNLWLNEVAKSEPEFKFLHPNFVIGSKNNACQKNRISFISFQHQEDTLRRFCCREYNLLFSTSVLEEGMNVPKCNLIARLDLPDNFHSYIHSKARARAPESKYCIFVKNNNVKFLETLSNYRQIESLLLHRLDNENASNDDVSDDEAQLLMKPYVVEGGAKVTMSTAIALVNRYCCKLPSDTFTRLTPKWSIDTTNNESGESQYICTLLLPINSPLKQPIQGNPMPNRQCAKMAVALRVCELLHKIGELDDNLLPVGKEAVKFEEDMLETFDIEQVPQGAPRPGTTKRRQYYYKMVADALRGPSPTPMVKCLLYRFSMKLTCPIPEEQNTRGRKIYNPAETSRGFGILTTKPIPPICSFPTFTRSGEVTVDLERIEDNFVFEKDKLSQIIDFHRYTFKDVLCLEKYPMIFKDKDGDNSFYLVPLNSTAATEDQKEASKYSIDWDFVALICKSKKLESRKIPEEERKQFEFQVENYSDAVVMPWYRNLDKPQFFYVAEICSDLTPLSDFPDFGYDTFKDYYKEKYNITIMNPKQPLLDVDHTSARLNLLTPRYVNRKGMTLPTSSEHTKKAKRENLQQKQILVPELCIIHPFPASLWRKAVCLPCILYRINSLLLAEQLRITVSREIGVGNYQLSLGFKWPALDFGWTLAEVLEKAQQAAKDERDFKEKKKLASHANRAKGKPLLDPQPTNMPGYKYDSSWTKNKTETNAGSISGDFEIDTFDPHVHKSTNKVEFDLDDCELLDEEVANINFQEALAGNVIDFKTTWGTPATATSDQNDVDGTEIRIRYGSPSNFEGTGWDSEWDTETEESNAFRLNLPGLGYISAPSAFNIQGLSMDLASCRDDDIWDSDYDDDEESIFDEMDSMYAPDSPKPADGPIQSFNMSEEINNEHVDQSPPSTVLKKISLKESFESDWLSDCSEIYCAPSDSFRKIEDDNNEAEIDVHSFPQIEEAVTIIQRCRPRATELLDNSTEISEDIDSGVDEVMDTNSSKNSSVVENPSNTPSVAPAFGELLPGRENLTMNTSNEKESSSNKIFRVRFDDQPSLSSNPGPSPSIILQAFTMSNANDGINLERLETVGDSFLKYAITAYLYCSYTDIHEGKLSYLRSKQISNLNLYRLGKKCGLGQLMIASKFDPNDNWLPPGYTVPRGLEQAFIDSGMPMGHWNIGNMKDLRSMDEEQIRKTIMEERNMSKPVTNDSLDFGSDINMIEDDTNTPYIRYNLLTQQSIPDKSIADCVEALIGSYLVSCGPRGALLFMSWLGLKVLPDTFKQKQKEILPEEDKILANRFGYLQPPKSPLLNYIPDAHIKLEHQLSGFENFEAKIGYKFRDRAYLLQAFSHASYHYNRLTDCYQRLEFLGDAVLDYLITRHLYEDPQQHYPGVLTDLRSALVNNTFFASLAVKYDFHKYFKAISPGLFAVISRFVDMKRSSPGLVHFEEYYLEEEECEDSEDVEVPKALGDIFESVAGAIYLDSGMSLDTVWEVYYAMMKPEIEYFSTHVPKSPIRELLESYPQTARFDRAEMTLAGKVRIRVEVVGKGQFVGVGRNKRIAKCTAAKRALRALKKTEKK